MRNMLDALSEVEVQSLRTSRRNVDSASEVLWLAEQVNRDHAKSIRDPQLEMEMRSLEMETKQSRQRWKLIKGTASAMVAGSGVDWAGDAELRNVVLDPDDDDG